MSKGFTNEEKEIIHEKLLSKGKELFERFGLQKTSISQLTKAVGIAQGTFYLFHSSKEELYFTILEQEEETLKSTILEHIVSPMTAGAFKQLLLYSIKTIEENPFIQQLFQQNEMERLVRKLPPDRMEKHINKDAEDLTPLVELWQSEGTMRSMRPEVVSGAFRSFIFMALHQKEIGEDVYWETMELMAESLAERLFK
ncbi:TetR/AcrR family transcriptional regulator [Bacillus tianshenii]|uniref:TetR/AcrR family transcriptional regulator n=1 Tax=Sutcliffiella tianshenii TaxID=1463404 RepID=UPI001CD1A8CD|nr:TetR/AcrR family transcriptional regulator [Bacillus tianshenii]MCA1320646.1 TetR/AcrR family transcriptional regulator [Bacillus tianshenii]